MFKFQVYFIVYANPGSVVVVSDYSTLASAWDRVYTEVASDVKLLVKLFALIR